MLDTITALEELAAIQEDAAKKSEELRREINVAYSDQADADREMETASKSRNTKKYQDAFAKFQMLSRFIHASESELSRLEDGHLISREEYGEMLTAIREDHYKTMRSAADQIRDKLTEIDEIHRKAVERMKELNRVVLLLHSEVYRGRIETQWAINTGEPSPVPFLKDDVIGPFIEHMKRDDSIAKTNFNIFAR
ncbi:MAG: hypothetical protein IJG52_05545 [Lachnospiraceae bacterium]|nr:hypothetical protein [Lachnospiraceae bacterium]